MNKFILLSILVFLISIQKSLAFKLDSLRIEKKDGKYFVIHQVNKGQTLFGTLRKYGSNLSEYKAVNPNIETEIQIGQILRIPYTKPIKQSILIKAKLVDAPKPTIVKNSETLPPKPIDKEEFIIRTLPPKTFKVETGMTLYSVAKRNGTTVAEVKRLNKMSSDAIKEGQVLIVKEGETIKQKKATPVVVTNEVVKGEKIIVKEESIPPVTNQKLPEKEIVVVEKEKVEVEVKKEQPIVEKPKIVEVKVEEKPKVEQVFTKPEVVRKDTIKSFVNEDLDPDRVVKVEEGIAEIIQVESKSGKYLALHKSAPLGTLVQVRNETNGASVWVKVIGRLPELDQNQNIIIKLSPRAMDRVSPVDKKFRAKISYSL